jgi:hypothetical protein
MRAAIWMTVCSTRASDCGRITNAPVLAPRSPCVGMLFGSKAAAIAASIRPSARSAPRPVLTARWMRRAADCPTFSGVSLVAVRACPMRKRSCLGSHTQRKAGAGTGGGFLPDSVDPDHPSTISASSSQRSSAASFSARAFSMPLLILANLCGSPVNRSGSDRISSPFVMAASNSSIRAGSSS